MRSSKARGVPRSASSVRAQITSAVSARISAASSSRQPMASMACVPLIRLMPSLGCSSMGSMPARARASPPGRTRACEFGLAFADQHQGHVRQRGEVARGAHAALRRHHRSDAAVEQVAEALGHQRADAGEALGQHVGADQHHGADHLARQRIAHAGGVRADHVALQLVEIAARNAHVGQQSDAGVDGVDGVVAGSQAVDEGARGQHGFDGGGRERDLAARRRGRSVQTSAMERDSRRARGSSAAFLAGGDQLFDLHQFGGVVAGVAGVAVFVRGRRPRLCAGRRGRGSRGNRLPRSGGSLRSSGWRRSARRGWAYPHRRSRARWWAGRRCAGALRARRPGAPCARSCGWWCRARWNRPPGPRACLPAGGARD